MNEYEKRKELEKELFRGVLDVFYKKCLKIEFKPGVRKKGMYNKIKFKLNYWLLRRFPLGGKYLFKSKTYKRIYERIRIKLIQNIDSTFEQDYTINDFSEGSNNRMIFESWVDYVLDNYELERKKR